MGSSVGSSFPIQNYRIEAGSSLQRTRLVKFMRRAYADIAKATGKSTYSTGAHLAETVQRHLSPNSHIWWVIDTQSTATPAGLPGINSVVLEPAGCLWLTEAIDQRSGQKQAYVFLLYVSPNHRKKGIGTALMQHAQHWAKQKGYEQMSLQVFEHNNAAMQLYEKLGYQSQAKWMSLDL
ncbi:MAG: GNAT family N-acetyltransferase [Cyanobacteria bacterium P01_D01_bin.105]